MYVPPNSYYRGGDSVGEPFEPRLYLNPIRRIPGEKGRDRRTFRRIARLFVQKNQKEYGVLLALQEDEGFAAKKNPDERIERIPRALMSKSPRESKPYTKRLIMGSGALALVAGLGIAVAHESAQNDTEPTLRDRVVASASALSQLGVCRKDVYAEWRYDVARLGEDPHNTKLQDRVDQDLVAMQTAGQAGIPCTKPQSSPVMAHVPGTQTPTLVAREMVTSFIVADWSAQRQDLEGQLSITTTGHEAQLRIDAGDQATARQ